MRTENITHKALKNKRGVFAHALLFAKNLYAIVGHLAKPLFSLKLKIRGPCMKFLFMMFFQLITFLLWGALIIGLFIALI